MGRFTTARDRKQGAVAIIGCVFLFTAFGVLVYGRFATSVGAAALYNRASVGVGFILFGISMLCFTPMVYLQRMHRRRIDPAVLARELKGILLGFFCYVVPFFLAMGALSSADSTGAFGLALMVAFGAIPFCVSPSPQEGPHLLQAHRVRRARGVLRRVRRHLDRRRRFLVQRDARRSQRRLEAGALRLL